MYKIIGADQKEYGPVSVDQLRQWVGEGRVNAQTKVLADGATEWKPLAEVSEFAEALGASARPTPAPSLPQAGTTAVGTREAALQAVKGPAIALIVTAGLAILYYAANAVFSIVGGGTMFHHELPPNLPPELRSIIEGMQGPLAGVVSLAIVALNAFVLFGAIKLMRLQSHGLAMVACVVAMLPCHCCCVLGLPFGIWALVVLNKPEVKSWFS